MDSLNLPSTSLIGKKLYFEWQKTGDVTFIVKNERIPAHRIVLAAISPKYETQFFGSHPDEGDINVDGVSAAAFNEFIKLFYLEKTGLTLENIEEILNLSVQSLVKTFVEDCEKFLRRQTDSANVCWIYHFAILYGLESVRGACEQFIGKSLPEEFRSINFAECDHGTLLHILDIEPLSCNEIDVFISCIKWARASCQRKNLDNADMGKCRAELGDAVTKIRFKSMTLNEFVNLNNECKGFFSAEEFVEITNILGGLLKFTSQNFNMTLRKRYIGEVYYEVRKKFCFPFKVNV